MRIVVNSHQKQTPCTIRFDLNTPIFQNINSRSAYVLINKSNAKKSIYRSPGGCSSWDRSKD